MKGVLVILDGLGDLPNRQFGDKTVLEVAHTPNLDFLANRGDMGMMHSVKPGFTPASDDAIVSIFGNKLMSATRGMLEAHGTGLKIIRGDLAYRVNFATIDNLKDGNVLDRRVGRTLTDNEAKILANELNNKIKLPVKFEFIPTIQHRATLVFKGGFSDNVSGNDSTYLLGKHVPIDKVGRCYPLLEDENAIYSANVVNEFLEHAYEILDKNNVNSERKRKGLLPANYLLLRGPGVEIPKLKQYKKWMSISYMPLEIGFSKLSGMETFSFPYPPLKRLDAYENLHEGLNMASEFSIKVLKKHYEDFDYAYIHIKETDLPGHDNKPFEKKAMIEYLDKNLFKFLKEFALSKSVKICVTGDHSTPCRLKAHSDDPVPVLFYNPSSKLNREIKFCEKNAIRGNLGTFNGGDLFKVIGFDR
ncbi:hypothetical protein COU57_02025 [Candidatus Pacearchaeota archaeon CG10_big_fil_rev_8_21_14_0_10_32_14]|nr:MAG: hypothetical protein COU57_02025 [Candidatus Pacearchaeota archaeon CG10_big_fil_rev_8_21_14_0_10_32_14]